jgi:cytochrome b6-f complex iron-sulfur subunit
MSSLFTRRQFLRLFLGGTALAWLGSVLYPVFRFVRPPPGADADVSSVRVAAATQMAFNSGRIVSFGQKPALLVRKADGNFAAFLAKCTHLDCIVQYRPDLGRIWCACHDGQYDLDGRNVAGPPPKPLEVLGVHLRGEDVFIVRNA